ncbi:MAG: hypothetical protein Q8N16_00745 [bacterium]|nr:hypothetical protein [bacterium]
MPTTIFSVEGVQYQVDETARQFHNSIIVLKGGNKYRVIVVNQWEESGKVVYSTICFTGEWRPRSHTAKWAIASYLKEDGHRNVFVARRSQKRSGI